MGDDKSMNIKKVGDGVAINSLLLTFVSVVTTLLGMIVSKLLSVNFTLQEYGTYSQALLVSSTLTSICLLGLSNAANFFYNRSNDTNEQKKYTSTIVVIECIAGGLCALFVLVFHNLIVSYFDNKSLSQALYLVAFTPALTNLIAIYQTLFVSIHKAKIIALRNLVVSVFRLVAVCYACYITSNIITVLLMILCLDFAQVIYYCFLFEKYKKGCVRIRSCSGTVIAEIFKYSIPLSVYSITCTVTRDVDKYVISMFADTETLAIYTNAAKILPFDLLTASFITVLIPVITRFIQSKSYLDAKNVFKLYLRIGYTATFIFVGGAIALAPYVMRFLYDEKYLPGLYVFIVYLIVDMIKFANVTTVLTAAGKTKSVMNVSVCIMIANLLFNIVAYKLLGMIGPALATLILTGTMTVVFLHLGAKEMKTSIIELFDIKRLSVILLEIIIVGILVHYLSNFMFDNNFSVFWVLCCCYGLYLLVLMMLNGKDLFASLRKLNQYK